MCWLKSVPHLCTSCLQLYIYMCIYIYIYVMYPIPLFMTILCMAVCVYVYVPWWTHQCRQQPGHSLGWMVSMASPAVTPQACTVKCIGRGHAPPHLQADPQTHLDYIHLHHAMYHISETKLVSLARCACFCMDDTQPQTWLHYLHAFNICKV